jgi:hypothetical protein
VAAIGFDDGRNRALPADLPRFTNRPRCRECGSRGPVRGHYCPGCAAVGRAPPFLGAHRGRGGAAMQGDVLAAPDAHPELQPLEPVEPAHALPIHAPPLSAHQHPDP